MTDRVALVEKLAAQFGAEFRLPMGSDPEAIREQANAERLALTVHASGRLRARSMRDDVLVVDEAIHCLGTLANGASFGDGRGGGWLRR